MSGTAIDGTAIWYVQSCAHNFLQEKDLKGAGFTPASQVIFNSKKNGNESYASYEVSEWFTHPKHDGSPTSGYDFAIGIINQESVKTKNFTPDYYAKETAETIAHGKFEPLESVG